MGKKTKAMEQISPEMAEAVDKYMDEYTREIIDMEMTPFCLKVEQENVGQLRVIRLFLEQKMFEVDAMCAVALKGETMKTSMSQEERAKFATLFALLARIEAKRGFIDYLLVSREIQ